MEVVVGLTVEGLAVEKTCQAESCKTRKQLKLVARVLHLREVVKDKENRR